MNECPGSRFLPDLDPTEERDWLKRVNGYLECTDEYTREESDCAICDDPPLFCLMYDQPDRHEDPLLSKKIMAWEIYNDHLDALFKAADALQWSVTDAQISAVYCMLDSIGLDTGLARLALNTAVDKVPFLEDLFGPKEGYHPDSLSVIRAPFESTTSFDMGTLEAPSAISRHSVNIDFESSWTDIPNSGRKQVWHLPPKSLVDVGEVVMRGDSTVQYLNQLRDCIEDRPSDKLLLIGGEHLVTHSSVISLLENEHPDLRLLWFDAHPDLIDDHDGESLTHGTVCRRILECMEEEGGSSDHIIQYGVRTYLVDWEEEMPEGIGRPTDWTELKKELELRGFFSNPVYISFDMDCLDPHYCPGVGTPVPEGPTPNSMYRLLRQLRHLGMNVVGADLVEYCPPKDVGDQTLVVATKIIEELLYLLIGRKGLAKKVE